MQVVTAFESDTPEQALADKVEEKFDYEQVESALKNDRTVAENVYARCAKHHFKKRVGDSIKLAKEGDHIPSPMWVTASSVTLYFDGTLDALRLHELTESLVAAVLTIKGEKEILLVETLTTNIAEVSPKIFKFSLKQKWGVNGV